jgi:hypothetical protein
MTSFMTAAGIGEDAGRADNHRVQGRVHRNAREAVGDVCRLQVTALDKPLRRLVLGGRQHRVDVRHLLVRQTRDGLHYSRRITRTQDRRQVTCVHEIDDIRRTIDLSRSQFRIHKHGRQHRIATGIRILRTCELQDRSVRSRPRDTVHRIVRVITGVVIRTGRDHGAVDVGLGARCQALHNPATERGIEVKAQAEVEVRIR